MRNSASNLIPTRNGIKLFSEDKWGELKAAGIFPGSTFAKPNREGKKAKRRKMKAISDDRRRQLPLERAAKLEAFERTGGRCAANIAGVCVGMACDGHEALKRSRGGDPTNPDERMPVCRPCHDWIETHDTEAKALGLSKSGHRPITPSPIGRPWLPDDHSDHDVQLETLPTEEGQQSMKLSNVAILDDITQRLLSHQARGTEKLIDAICGPAPESRAEQDDAGDRLQFENRVAQHDVE